MRIVIDTNRIIAATILDGVSRRILFSDNFEFFSPEYTVIEINEHKKEIMKKSSLDGTGFRFLLSIILERVRIAPFNDYKNFIEESRGLISDIFDVPFLALCLALKTDGIWTDDKHFMEQDKVKVFRTADMIDLL